MLELIWCIILYLCNYQLTWKVYICVRFGIPHYSILEYFFMCSKLKGECFANHAQFLYSMNDWTLDSNCLVAQCCFFIQCCLVAYVYNHVIFLLICHLNKLCQRNDSTLKISWISFLYILMNFHFSLLIFHAICLEHPKYRIFYFQIISPKIIVWW